MSENVRTERIGEVLVDALSDGSFVARPSYFGPHVDAGARPKLFDTGGAATLPIGCFLVRSSDRVILVDAGLGPDHQDLPDGMSLTGGCLPAELERLQIEPTEITDVVVTHLHVDHVGWLFDRSALATFPMAAVWLGRADWSHFVTGAGEMATHIRAGLQALAPERLRRLDVDTPIAPDVVAVMTPGHTPGSLSVRITSEGQSLWLLGDAITCPVQLYEPTWHSFADVAPEEAEGSRRLLWHELSQPATRGVGSHFPGLVAGRVVGETPAWLPGT